MNRYDDDGVTYERVPCVRCHEPMEVATAALLVADRKSWPICGECWREIDYDEAAREEGPEPDLGDAIVEHLWGEEGADTR